MSSKARRIPDVYDRLMQDSIKLADLGGLIRARQTPASIVQPIHSGESASSSTGGTGDFLALEGGSMFGNIAFEPSLIVAVNGRVNLNPSGNPPDNSSYILVTGAGTPDDIKFIDGGQRNGQLLIYQGTNQQIQNILNANLLNTTSIVGDGLTNTVTVLLPDTGTLQNGDRINISGTNNFDANDAIVSNLVENTSFTFDLRRVGSTTSETTGFVQDGNIVTPDGETVVLDGNLSALNAPVIVLIFDATIPSGGGWRIISGNVSFGGGGGGVSYPLNFPELDGGTVGSATVNIDFSLNTRHSIKYRLNGDINLAFTNPPTDESAYSNIIFVQDDDGGHTVTLPSNVINKDIVEAGILTGPNDETGIVIKYSFGIFYAFLETGNTVSGGGGGGGDPSQWSVFPAIQNVNINNNDLLAVANIDFDGIAATIEGLANLNFFQTNQEIDSLSDRLFYQVDLNQFHQFAVGGMEALRIEDAGGGVLRLGMNQNSVVDAKDYRLDSNALYAIPGSVPGLGYDDTANRLILNYPTGSSLYVYENSTIGTTVLTANSLASNIVNADNVLQLGVSLTLPTVVGEFRENGTDVLVFSGGQLRNLSDIGGSQTPWESDIDAAGFALLNFGRLDSDAASLPITGKIRLGNNELLSWLNTDGITIASFGLGNNNLLTVTGANLSLLTNDIVNVTTVEGVASGALNFNQPTISQLINLQWNGITEWTFARETLGGRNLILNNTLVINDSLTNPVADGVFSRNGNVLGLEIPEFAVRRTTTVGNNPTSLNIVKVDASPGSNELLGSLNFQVDDSGVITTYARMLSEIKDATDSGRLRLDVRADNSNFQNVLTMEGADSSALSYLGINARINSDIGFGFEGAGSNAYKIRPVGPSTRLGIVVQDNLDFTVGSSGTNAIPFAIISTINNTNLDNAFGNHVGATGMNTSIIDPGLYVKISVTQWRYYGAGTIVT